MLIFISAVVAIATLKRYLKHDCLILVKQYRPPVKGYTIELPAGKRVLSCQSSTFYMKKYKYSFYRYTYSLDRVWYVISEDIICLNCFADL